MFDLVLYLKNSVICFFALGVIGNGINVFIFSQKRFRKESMFRYLLMCAVTNTLNLLVKFPTTFVYQDYFSVNTSGVSCKLTYFFANFLPYICIDAHFTLHLTFIDGSNKSLKFLNNNLKLNLTLGSNIEISDIISSYDKRLSLLRLFYLCKKKDRNENTNYYFLNPNKYFCSEWFIHIKNDKLMTNQNFLIERQFNFHRKVLNFGKPLNNLNEFIPVEEKFFILKNTEIK